MQIIKRAITEKLNKLLYAFPVVTLIGSHCCGKTTTLRNEFPDYRYVSLDDLDIQELASTDPKHFLSVYNNRVIIDNIQYAPKLLLELQKYIDSAGEMGMFILAGTRAPLLMKQIQQCLADRTAILTLTSLSIQELYTANILPSTVNELLFRGGFPEILVLHRRISDFFRDYIKHFIEHEVHDIRNITNSTVFLRFLRLCAGRCGQLLNLTDLANEAGINRATAKSWIEVLEECSILYLLKPYPQAFQKRLVKSPKIYFYDTGLVCALLGIISPRQVDVHYMRGVLFENLIINEYQKRRLSVGRSADVFFWQDNNGIDVSLVAEENATLHIWKIFSSETMNQHFFNHLHTFCRISETPIENAAIVYGGDTSNPMEGYYSWKDW